MNCITSKTGLALLWDILMVDLHICCTWYILGINSKIWRLVCKPPVTKIVYGFLILLFKCVRPFLDILYFVPWNLYLNKQRRLRVPVTALIHNSLVIQRLRDLSYSPFIPDDELFQIIHQLRWWIIQNNFWNLE